MTLMPNVNGKNINRLIAVKNEFKDIFDLVKQIPNNSLDVESGIRILLNLAPIGGAIEKLIFGNKDKKEIEQIKGILWLLGVGYKKLEHRNILILLFV